MINHSLRVILAVKAHSEGVDAATDIEIIGEAETGRDVISLTKALQPDVLVLDLNLPDIDGLAATRQIRDFAPNIAILLRTSQPDDAAMMAMLEAGAASYVDETVSAQGLIAAIRATADGESAFTSVITSRVLRRALGQIAASPPALLSPRELDVLRCAARKMENKEIAAELKLSFRTVQTHLANIYGKLGVTRRSEAVKRAIEEGWIPLSSKNPEA